MKNIIILITLFIWFAFTLICTILVFPIILICFATDDEWFDFPKELIRKID